MDPPDDLFSDLARFAARRSTQVGTVEATKVGNFLLDARDLMIGEALPYIASHQIGR
jgi:hypothetical protein